MNNNQLLIVGGAVAVAYFVFKKTASQNELFSNKSGGGSNLSSPTPRQLPPLSPSKSPPINGIPGIVGIGPFGGSGSFAGGAGSGSVYSGSYLTGPSSDSIVAAPASPAAQAAFTSGLSGASSLGSFTGFAGPAAGLIGRGLGFVGGFVTSMIGPSSATSVPTNAPETTNGGLTSQGFNNISAFVATEAAAPASAVTPNTNSVVTNISNGDFALPGQTVGGITPSMLANIDLFSSNFNFNTDLGQGFGNGLTIGLQGGFGYSPPTSNTGSVTVGNINFSDTSGMATNTDNVGFGTTTDGDAGDTGVGAAPY